MKILFRLIIISILLITLSGCSLLPGAAAPTAPSEADSEKARQSLVDFFQLLHAGQYQAAAELYAGDYQWLIDSNPDVPAADAAALLERGCTQNGLVCLEVLNIKPLPAAGADEVSFQVEFQWEDGSLFVLGPCCGADETEMPPVSTFEYRLLRGPDGSWGVADLPPYVP